MTKEIESSRLQNGRTLPRVSVLMAVYNTAPYLQEALLSITRQSFGDFEFLVIDDGSSDGSTELLQAFAANEPRMMLTVRKNLGLVATRNELLNAARGALVAWMDSDDVSTVDRLALQASRFESDPELICLGGVAQCIDPDGNPMNLERYPLDHAGIVVDQRKGGAMRFPTTMMRRQPALDVGGFRQPFSIGEDFDLLLRLSEVGKMANLPETIYLYRQHLSSVCATLGPRWAAYRDEILELARERRERGADRLQRGETVSIAAPEPANTRRLVSQTYSQWARYALMNGNRRLAWKYAKAAVTAQPMAPAVWKTVARVILDTK